MQKSVLVAVDYLKKIPKYKVSIRRSSKLMVGPRMLYLSSSDLA